jgi:hypothetical protein
MAQLIIRHNPEAAPGTCALCGQRPVAAQGPQLLLADEELAVCRDCGRKHAPSLVALLDLAGAAERVGRIGRHTVFPPLTALLDLAQAAEKYMVAVPACVERVA